MQDVKTPRGKRPLYSVPKSNTAVALPTIHKVLANTQSNSKHNNSSYLQIAQNISCNVQYDKKNTFFISKEQDKLKNILKKMNYDTMNMINNIKPRRVQRTKSKTQLSTIADREVENSKKMINNLEYQIDKLKEKYTKIVDHAEEKDVLQKIKIVKMEIQAIRHQNVGARVSVDKEGKNIIKEFNISEDPKIKIMQNDARMAELRLQKLRSQTIRVREQKKKLFIKIKQLQSSSKSIEQEYAIVRSKEQEQITKQNKEMLLKQKNYQISNIKHKTEEKSTMAKQKYYKILKFVQQSVSNTSTTESKIAEIQKKNKQMKEESTFLEAELKQVKRIKLEKSRLLQDFLLSKQKIRSEDSILINEFVSESSTDFLKPACIKSEFDQLASEKDLQRYTTISSKKQDEIFSKAEDNKQKIVVPNTTQQIQISKLILSPIQIQPQKVVQK